MGKSATLFILTLLLASTLTFAGRSGPAFPTTSPVKIIQADADQSTTEVEDSCEGVAEDECLMRRTLAAHVDYIYTQKHKP